MKRFLTICLLVVITLGQGGCLKIEAYGELVNIYDTSGTAETVILTADGAYRPCGPAGSDPETVDCSYSEGTDRESLSDSEIRALGLRLLISLLQDPLVLEVPFGANHFSGTYDNGAGISGNLNISEPMLGLPVDVNTTMLAESGMEIIVVDFPAPAEVPQGDYHYTLTFNMPAGGPSLRIKPMLTGRLTLGNKTYYPPLLPCASSFTDVPPVSIFVAQTARPLLTSDYLSSVKPCDHKVYDYTGAPPPTVAVVEFYNASLDHYFISIDPNEINDLDTGVHPGWKRTGLTFNAYAGPSNRDSPVCRYYIPPQHGDSHFFSADPNECAAVLQRTMTDPNYSGYVAESPNVFYIGLPDTGTGACPAGTVPVYRLWNNRADSNHRYTTSTTVVAQMLAKGYVQEGYGPNAVIMCATL